MTRIEIDGHQWLCKHMFLQLIYKFTITVDFLFHVSLWPSFVVLMRFLLQQPSHQVATKSPSSGTKGIQWHSEVEKKKEKENLKNWTNRKRMESRIAFG